MGCHWLLRVWSYGRGNDPRNLCICAHPRGTQERMQGRLGPIQRLDPPNGTSLTSRQHVPFLRIQIPQGSQVHSKCVCAQSLQSCLTLYDPMNCSPPGSSVHGILQARILEWVAMPLSRGSSWPGIKPESLRSPKLAGTWAPPGKPHWKWEPYKPNVWKVKRLVLDETYPVPLRHSWHRAWLWCIY